MRHRTPRRVRQSNRASNTIVQEGLVNVATIANVQPNIEIGL